jgi:hypothetical protein
MVNVVFGALGLVLVHWLVGQHGSADAAIWITGGVGVVSLVCLGLARA